MLIIKNTVKNQNGDILSELELLKKDFEEIVCAVPEDETVEIHRTITINEDDGSETVHEEKKIFNNALGVYEPPYIEGGGNYDGIQ